MQFPFHACCFPFVTYKLKNVENCLGNESFYFREMNTKKGNFRKIEKAERILLCKLLYDEDTILSFTVKCLGVHVLLSDSWSIFLILKYFDSLTQSLQNL